MAGRAMSMNKVAKRMLAYYCNHMVKCGIPAADILDALKTGVAVYDEYQGQPMHEPEEFDPLGKIIDFGPWGV